MSIRRKTYTDGNNVAVLEERYEPEVVDAHADTSAGESEVVSRSVGPADMARRWVLWTQAVIAFGMLLIETALTFRLVFALTASNAANGFVSFIYDITGPFVAPFENIANESASGNGVFEPETVIAMTVYAVAAFILIAFMGLAASAPGSKTDVVTRTRHGHYQGHA
jgi:hypothetical protein